MKAIIYTDGGARGNPGPAGIGAVITIGKNQHTVAEYIGEATNNQAEYKAVILALTKARELGVDEATVYLDSELVQQQLLRKYKVKNQDLATLFVQAWNLSLQFKSIKFINVMRADNTLADQLVNQAIDDATLDKK